MVLLLLLFAGNLYKILLIRDHLAFVSAVNHIFFRAKRFLNRIVFRCLGMSVDH